MYWSYLQGPIYPGCLGQKGVQAVELSVLKPEQLVTLCLPEAVDCPDLWNSMCRGLEMRENPYLWEPEAECGATMKGGRAPILLSCLWKDLPVSRWPLAIFIMSVLCPHCFLLWKSQQFVSVNVRCCMCRIESELSQSAVERGETNSDQDCAL